MHLRRFLPPHVVDVPRKKSAIAVTRLLISTDALPQSTRGSKVYWLEMQPLSSCSKGLCTSTTLLSAVLRRGVREVRGMGVRLREVRFGGCLGAFLLEVSPKLPKTMHTIDDLSGKERWVCVCALLSSISVFNEFKAIRLWKF